MSSTRAGDGFDKVFKAMKTQVVIRGRVQVMRSNLWFWTGGEVNGKAVAVSWQYDLKPGSMIPDCYPQTVDLSEECSLNQDYVFERFMVDEAIMHSGNPSSRLVYVLNRDAEFRRKWLVESETSIRLRDHVIRAHLLLRMALQDPSRISSVHREDFTAAQSVFRILDQRISQFLFQQLCQRERALALLQEGRSSVLED